MEYTAQLLAIMQDKAESRGGVAVLGESSMPLLWVLAVSAYGSTKRHTLTSPDCAACTLSCILHDCSRICMAGRSFCECATYLFSMLQQRGMCLPVYKRLLPVVWQHLASSGIGHCSFCLSQSTWFFWSTTMSQHLAIAGVYACDVWVQAVVCVKGLGWQADMVSSLAWHFLSTSMTHGMHLLKACAGLLLCKP